MSRTTRIAISAFACVLLISLAPARADIIIGAGADGGNYFPFTGGTSSSTRYQQVYKSSFFTGPTLISSISFYNNNLPGAVFRTADYAFTLSTSNHVVNTLNTSDLNDNPGADAALFASVHLAGATGSIFTIAAGAGGGAAFAYDPSQGDLLVDIVVSNAVNGTGTGYLDAYNGNAGGIFSRAHNYGAGFENFGLKTGFNTQTSAVPEPSTLALGTIGASMVGLIGWRRRRTARDR